MGVACSLCCACGNAATQYSQADLAATTSSPQQRPSFRPLTDYSAAQVASAVRIQAFARGQLVRNSFANLESAWLAQASIKPLVRSPTLDRITERSTDRSTDRSTESGETLPKTSADGMCERSRRSSFLGPLVHISRFTRHLRPSPEPLPSTSTTATVTASHFAAFSGLTSTSSAAVRELAISDFELEWKVVPGPEEEDAAEAPIETPSTLEASLTHGAPVSAPYPVSALSVRLPASREPSTTSLRPPFEPSPSQRASGRASAAGGLNTPARAVVWKAEERTSRTSRLSESSTASSTAGSSRVPSRVPSRAPSTRWMGSRSSLRSSRSNNASSRSLASSSHSLMSGRSLGASAPSTPASGGRTPILERLAVGRCREPPVVRQRTDFKVRVAESTGGGHLADQMVKRSGFGAPLAAIEACLRAMPADALHGDGKDNARRLRVLCRKVSLCVGVGRIAPEQLSGALGNVCCD